MEFDVESRRPELERICHNRNVLRLALFGSAASGDFDESESDLDFVVEFVPMKPVEHKGAYFGLLRDLESLFGRDVDLIEPQAVVNPYVRRSIEAHQKVVYAAA